jgi:hypothetical protein
MIPSTREVIASGFGSALDCWLSEFSFILNKPEGIF